MIVFLIVFNCLKLYELYQKAAFYNVVSSVLAFVGMVVGLVLGNIDNFSTWMFAATAGHHAHARLCLYGVEGKRQN